jgi:hypothetical protein
MTTTAGPSRSPHTLTETIRRRPAMLRSLLLCGVLSSLFYVGMDLVSGLLYPGYSFLDQWVSELSAIGAPTRPLWLALGPVYQLLMVLFGVGVWFAAGERRALRIAAGLIVAYGLVGFTAPFTPMHSRQYLATYGPGLTDRLHLVSTAVVVLLMFAAIGFAAAAFGTRFRVYSMATVVLSFAFGMWTGRMAPQVEADLPTPWGGVIERVSIWTFLVWVVVLAMALLWRSPAPRTLDHRGPRDDVRT